MQRVLAVLQSDPKKNLQVPVFKLSPVIPVPAYTGIGVTLIQFRFQSKKPV